MKFNITRVGWPDSYGERNRRKPVVCALCKVEETRNDSGVCDSCKRSYMVGKAYENYLVESKGQDDQVVAKMPAYPSVSRLYALTREEIEQAHDIDRLYSPGRYLADAILALADVTKAQRQEATNLLALFPKDKAGNYDYREIEFYTGKKVVFAILQKVFDLLRYTLQKEYQEGYNDGQRVLTQLAAGEMTVEQLNKFETDKRLK